MATAVVEDRRGKVKARGRAYEVDVLEAPSPELMDIIDFESYNIVRTLYQALENAASTSRIRELVEWECYGDVTCAKRGLKILGLIEEEYKAVIANAVEAITSLFDNVEATYTTKRNDGILTVDVFIKVKNVIARIHEDIYLVQSRGGVKIERDQKIAFYKLQGDTTLSKIDLSKLTIPPIYDSTDITTEEEYEL